MGHWGFVRHCHRPVSDCLFQALMHATAVRIAMHTSSQCSGESMHHILRCKKCHCGPLGLRREGRHRPVSDCLLQALMHAAAHHDCQKCNARLLTMQWWVNASTYKMKKCAVTGGAVASTKALVTVSSKALHIACK